MVSARLFSPLYSRVDSVNFIVEVLILALELFELSEKFIVLLTQVEVHLGEVTVVFTEPLKLLLIFFTLRLMAPRDIGDTVPEFTRDLTKLQKLLLPIRSNFVVELPRTEVPIVHECLFLSFRSPRSILAWWKLFGFFRHRHLLVPNQ